MFSLFKYNDPNSAEGGLLNVRRTDATAPRTQHIACKACHAKKVKCSGHSDGCIRCKAKSIPCEYAPHLPRGRSRHLKTRPNKATESSNSSSGASASPMEGQTQPESELEIPHWGGSFSSNPLAQHDMDFSHEYDVSWSMFNDETDVPTDGLTTAGMEDMNVTFTGFDQDSISFTSFHPNFQNPSPQTPPAIMSSSHDTVIIPGEEIMHFSNLPPNCAADSTDSQDATLSPKKPDLSEVGIAPTFTCNCIHCGVSILESLQLSNEQYSESASFDQQLNVKKAAIDTCMTMMGCATCFGTSTLVMLLATICEKILSSFETWSSKYSSTSSRCQRPSDTPAPISKVVDSTLGKYSISQDDEKCSVLRALAILQLKRLVKVLERLSSVAESHDLGVHKTMLRSYVGRAETASRNLITKF